MAHFPDDCNNPSKHLKLCSAWYVALQIRKATMNCSLAGCFLCAEEEEEYQSWQNAWHDAEVTCLYLTGTIFSMFHTVSPDVSQHLDWNKLIQLSSVSALLGAAQRCARLCVSGSEFGDGGGDVLQGGSSLRGGESLDGLQRLVAMVTAQVHRRAHAFLRLNRCQKLWMKTHISLSCLCQCCHDPAANIINCREPEKVSLLLKKEKRGKIGLFF